MSKKLVIFARDIFQIILYKMLNHLFATAPLSILVFFTSSCLVAGQVERDGSCPDIQYMSSVDLPTLQGSWYLHSRYRGLDNENARCYKADFTPGSDNVHTITNFRISNTDDCVKVNTETHTSLSDGYFMVSNFERGAIRLIYDILTYCNDYIIIYVCHDLPLSKHNEFVWVHTRVPNPDQSIEDAYKRALNDQQISTIELELISHERCQGYERRETVSRTASRVSGRRSVR
ncbi:lopap-like isoform X1 [Eurosta solidaginis]|uniref:lopap-like isoform X1 n=1 Tax=Eurosta solidaginis TaxID=178769 RepID=UPI003530B7A2